VSAPPKAAGALQSVNPATGEAVRSVPVAGPDAVERRIVRAHAAQGAWAGTPMAERAAVMRRAAELLKAEADAHARLMAAEMGKPVTQGRGEAAKCAWCCEHYAEHAAAYLAPQPARVEATSCYVAFAPLGLVLAVMPWNFPFWQVFRAAVPALMAGNGVLLKHAANVPGCAEAVEDLLRRAGLPDGLFANLPVGSERVAGLIAHPKVAAVTLTGSGPAGRAVAAAAGAALKKTVLELGGSDAYLILADADLDRAAEACAAARLVNAGQSCIAAKRFVAVAAVHDGFVQRLAGAMAAARVGDPLDAATEVGPLARTDLRDALHAQVTASVAAGARVVVGGEVPDGPGAFYPPTVLADVPPGCPAAAEELFGPVAAVLKARDEADAVRIANDSPFGLGAGVFTADLANGERIAREALSAGSCFVNAAVHSDPRLPFGGIRESGYGRELGAFGIREFVNVKTVLVA